MTRHSRKPDALIRKNRLTKNRLTHKISRELMGSELDLGRMPSASVSRSCRTSSREGRTAQPVIHSPWAAIEGWRVAWVRHPFGNSDQAKAPRRTLAKVTTWAMSHGPWNAPAGFKPESLYEVKQRSHELSGWEPGLWLRHTSHLYLTAPVEAGLCINLVQESNKKYLWISSHLCSFDSVRMRLHSFR